MNADGQLPSIRLGLATGDRKLSRTIGRFVPADGPFADAVHIFVMCTLAIAQPLWSLVGNSGEFFLARNADMPEVALAAMAVLLIPPAVLLAVQWIASLFSSRLRRSVHVLELGALALVMSTRVMSRLVPEPLWLLFLAVAAGTAIVLVAIVTTRAIRWTLTALAPLPIILLLMFLFASEARAVVAPVRAEGGIGAVNIARKAPVLFLVFDEFPGTSIMDERLHIDAARAPNLARFAQQATWYSNATTVHEVTDMAVSAILTGKRTTKKALPVARQHPVNLFSLLGAGGYVLRVNEFLTRLCPRAFCSRPSGAPLIPRVRSELMDLAVVYAHESLPSSMTGWLPQLNIAWGNFLVRPSNPGGRRAPGLRGVLNEEFHQQARIDRLVRNIGNSPGPILDYLHVTIPHAPFGLLPNGKAYENTDMPGLQPSGIWDKDEFLTDQAQQRLLLQVGYADLQFGRIIDGLRASGRFDDTMVVMVSDHGSANLPGLPRRAFSHRSLGEVASVPLIIKLPGQKKGRVVHRSAETVDILPTIADALGFQIPGEVEGKSLLAAGGRSRSKRLVASTGREFSIPADFPQRRFAVSRNYQRFARQGDSLNLFAMGQYQALVGQESSSFEVSEEPGLAAILEHPDYLRGSVPPSVSPSHIVGKLSGLPEAVPPGSPVDLLVAVNGRIASTSRSFAVDGDHARLSMFVPEEVLTSGVPTVEIFAVTGPVARPRLWKVPWS